MIIVHHLNNSRSQRVLWLLEELGVPYEIKHYKRDAKTMLAPPELKAIHPLGKSPVISDGDRVIAETGAIIEYLIERYGKGALIPALGSNERLRYNYWLHYAEGSFMPLLVMTLIFSRIPAMTPALVRPIARGIVKGVNDKFLGPNLKTHSAFIEKSLAENTWFAGEEFSAADIQMSFPVEAVVARGGQEGTPKMAAFLERIHARPAYKKAMERGGPFELMR